MDSSEVVFVDNQTINEVENVGQINGDRETPYLNKEDDSDPESENENTNYRPTDRPTTTSTIREHKGGFRGKANTPVSLFNDMESLHFLKRSGTFSSEEVYTQAMTLMSDRCNSANPNVQPLVLAKDLSYGPHLPNYFFVQQTKPVLMKPLKVWRGFKGNIYFEPISINKVNVGDSSANQITRASTASPSHSFGRISRNTTNSRLSRAMTAHSSKSDQNYRLIPSSPQIFVLDKRAVLQSTDTKLHEELHQIHSLESTGSLAVCPANSTSGNRKNKERDRKLLNKRNKVCKGSNYHQFQNRVANIANLSPKLDDAVVGQKSPRGFDKRTLSRNKSQSQNSLLDSWTSKSFLTSSLNSPGLKSKFDLTVSGDTFNKKYFNAMGNSSTPPRATMNTPDIIQNLYDGLPPLDKSEISNSEENGSLFSRPSSFTEQEMKSIMESKSSAKII